MAVYVYGGPGEKLAEFAYDSLVNSGISRFFWSYDKRFDLNILTSRNWEDLDSEEFTSRAKSEFLLKIKPGDYVVHVNVPIWGEVTVGKVVSGYFFQRDLPSGQNDGRHCLNVKDVFSFNRNDERVTSAISRRLKLRGSHWRISQQYEKEFFSSLASLKIIKESKYLEFVKICKEGSDDEIIKALKSGANPNATDEQNNALFRNYIVENRSGKVLKAWIEAGCYVNPYDTDLIALAAKHNPDPEMLAILVRNKLSVTYGSNYSDRDIYEYLNNHQYNDGSTLLCIAAEYNNDDVVSNIIRWGANVNHKIVNFTSWIPLFCAIKNKKYPNVLEVLIEAGAEEVIDDQGISPLFYAVRENNIEAVKILLKAGANYGKQHALSRAVEDANVEALKILINAGADVNKVKIGQYQALEYAKLMVQQTKNMQNSGRLERVKSMLNQLENKVKQAPTLMEREILEEEYIKAKAIYDAAVLELTKNERFAECVKLLTQAGAK